MWADYKFLTWGQVFRFCCWASAGARSSLHGAKLAGEASVGEVTACTAWCICIRPLQPCPPAPSPWAGHSRGPPGMANNSGCTRLWGASSSQEVLGNWSAQLVCSSQRNLPFPQCRRALGRPPASSSASAPVQVLGFPFLKTQGVEITAVTTFRVRLKPLKIIKPLHGL